MNARAELAWGSVAGAFSDFTRSVEAIVDLTSFSRSQAAELDTVRASCAAAAAEIVQLAPRPLDREMIQPAVSKFWAEAKVAIGEVSTLGDLSAEAAANLRPVVASFVDSVRPQGIGVWAAYLLVQRVLEDGVRRDRAPMLQESLLVSTVSAFEAFVARIIRASLLFNPKQVYEMEKRPTWAEVLEAESLEQVRDRAIDSYVDSLMYKDLEAWLKHIAKATKMADGHRQFVFDSIHEIVQRRHVLVHNGGTVSTQYLQKVGRRGSGLEVGERLLVDDAYLDEAIDALMLAGCAIAQTSLAAIFRAQRPWAAPQLESLANPAEAVYQFLYKGRVQCAARAYDILEPYLLDDGSRQNLKVNSWIARKRIGGAEVIREQVAAWDTSALGERYALARHCLLGDMESAIPLVKKLTENGSINAFALATWPVLEPVREHLRERSRDSAVKVALDKASEDDDLGRAPRVEG